MAGRSRLDCSRLYLVLRAAAIRVPVPEDGAPKSVTQEMPSFEALDSAVTQPMPRLA